MKLYKSAYPQIPGSHATGASHEPEGVRGECQGSDLALVASQLVLQRLLGIVIDVHIAFCVSRRQQWKSTIRGEATYFELT